MRVSYPPSFIDDGHCSSGSATPRLSARAECGRALEECLSLCIQLSDAVVVALISMLGVIIAALITGLATVIAAWLQSRRRDPS